MRDRWIFIAILLVLSASVPVSAKVGGGDITFRPKDAGEVMFTHDSHVTRLGLKCSECHYRLYSTVSQHARVTMREMEQGKSCGACHDGKQAFDVRANCDRCHRK